MERGFLSQKGSRGGRGVKEKSANVSNIEVVKEKDINDEHVAMKVKSPLVEHTNAVKTGEGSYPPLPTRDLIESRSSEREDVGNVPVWVKIHGGPVTAFSEDDLSVIATKLDTLFMLDSYTSDMMFEDLLIDGQVIIVDEAGNPLKSVECPGDYDSEDEVASVDNDMARSLASEMRDSYGNGDYDEDPYDDDMYEGQDLQQEIQAICDNLDIQVRGRKKK
ncbi:hypothetical protein Tco_1127777 [Tanacetum coccineum]